ncbi:Bgt-3770 [Blumeria graminis f. sp. tritici]|uniref:C2H2 type master regulator of conidiophore development brlA n=2 Tax=Blumeria graminis f. sp. tritici TaxID=62690 RepID=A0A061HGX7_BLUGR|nr:Transcriptional repressor [Blumeria graminis f. sp. tritici 96224]VDB92655.1 Bgt-3770 [Blumeria graminis f. sp. tritici]
MHVRDASGRCVSLLNDEPGPLNAPLSTSSYTYHHPMDIVRSSSIRSNTSSPPTPGLTRAHSVESVSFTPHSPATPSSHDHINYHYSGSRLGLPDQAFLDYREKSTRYESFPPHPNYSDISSRSAYDPARPSYAEPQVFEEDQYRCDPLAPERGPKRYPCRYRDSHHCLKTFTTSGHASRHSKIHTAEKGVSCTWEGCNKKFTRSDNMKQHLETHSKERSRPPKLSTSAFTSKLTVPAGVRKSTITLSTSRASATEIRNPTTTLSNLPGSRNSSASSDLAPLLDPAMFKSFHTLAQSNLQHRHPALPTNGLETLALLAGARP